MRQRRIIREVTASPGKEDQVLTYLKEQLASYDRAGQVVTVLVLDEKRQRLTQYGERLDEGTIGRQLNIVTKQGVGHQSLRDITSWKKGILVRRSLFGPSDLDKWVALVNIELSPYSIGPGVIEVLSYPCVLPA